VHRVRHTINRRRPFSRKAGTSEEHQAIMQAIINGDSEHAFTLVRSHVLRVGAATLTDTGLGQPTVADELS
jgi:DNA-binding FadR family transcriptional regulator